MNTKFVTSHNDWDANLVFPLVVTRFKLGKIYVDPMWGVRIEHIAVDKKPLAGEKWDAFLDDLNFSKIAIASDPFIYQVRRSNLVFAKTFQENGDYELEKYTIPETAQLIAIEYRLRETPESVGPVMTLVSHFTE